MIILSQETPLTVVVFREVLKIAAVRFTTIHCEPNTTNRHIEIYIFLVNFVPVLTTLCIYKTECKAGATAKGRFISGQYFD